MNWPTLRWDFKWLLVAILVIANLATLILWKPWQSSDHTITVTGEGIITAAPDEFSFYPSYEAAGASSTEAIAKVSAVGNEVVAKLKELGVDQANLTTNVSTSQKPEPYLEGAPQSADELIASYSITATVHDEALAKKVLDYLATTQVVYGVSPSSTFKDDTRSRLELEVRQKALENARQKAEQTAAELGLKLGKVVSVSDLNQYGGPILLRGGGATSSQVAEDTAVTPDLEIGSQKLNFSITVEYQLR